MRSSSGNAAVIVIVVFTAGILMFGIPLLIISSKQDDAAKLAAQQAVTEFVLKGAKTGEITQEDYDNLVLTLSSIRAYDPSLQIQILDENPTKKSNKGATTSGIYYALYDTQIDFPLELKEGDTITVIATPIDVSIFEQLSNAIYRVFGSNSTGNVAQASAMVTKNAN